MAEPLVIDLAWPARELNPNRQQHPMALHRFKKAAKNEAAWATKIAMHKDWLPEGEKVRVQLIAHPPKNWSTGDADNLIARCKAHLDGIASVIGINDSEFEAPTVTWAEKSGAGKLIAVLR